MFTCHYDGHTARFIMLIVKKYNSRQNTVTFCVLWFLIKDISITEVKKRKTNILKINNLQIFKEFDIDKVNILTHLISGQNKISKALVGVHEGGIFSVCVMKDGSILSGGGKDRRIIQWSNAYQKTGQETEVGILVVVAIPVGKMGLEIFNSVCRK